MRRTKTLGSEREAGEILIPGRSEAVACEYEIVVRQEFVDGTPGLIDHNGTLSCDEDLWGLDEATLRRRRDAASAEIRLIDRSITSAGPCRISFRVKDVAQSDGLNLKRFLQ